MVDAATPADQYALGRTIQETERLKTQATFVEPFTERFLKDAGIGPGMKVLDLGSGAGDVSILCSRLVGAGGTVVGIDTNSSIVDGARARVAEAEYGNISFQAGDIADLEADADFDAVVGRYVLMFVPDPVATLKHAARLLRPGGVAAFQEPDFTQGPYAEPPSALLHSIWMWITEAFRRSGADTEMGLKLHRTFGRAGFCDLHLAADRFIGTGQDWGGYDHLAGLVTSLLPVLERFGLATAEEVDPTTLADRLRHDVISREGIVVWQTLIRLWGRKM